MVQRSEPADTSVDQTMMAAAGDEPPAPMKESDVFRLTPRISVAILAVVYLSFASVFTTHIRAWMGDDEIDHTKYVEYIVEHGDIPRISLANGIASHQPPLYYLVAAGWQDILRIHAFQPEAPPGPKNPFAVIATNTQPVPHYSASEHRQAVYLHELRILSIALGLGTVLLAYAAAMLVGARQELALATGLFVALMPKELAVSSVVTNDALVIPLCGLGLVFFLLAERARGDNKATRRRLYALAMGLTLGAAAITKFDSLPVAAALFLLLLLPAVLSNHRLLRPRWALPIEELDPTSGTSQGLDAEQVAVRGTGPIGSWLDRRALVDVAVAAAGFLAVSGWWFIRNKYLYGQFSATTASQNYVKSVEYYFRPSPLNGTFLHTAENDLLYSSWFALLYARLPMWINQVLGVFALVSLGIGSWVMLGARRWRLGSSMGIIASLGFIGCAAGGLLGFLIVLKSTGLAFGRNTYVGIAGFAFIVVVGAMAFAGYTRPRMRMSGLFVWPAALFALDLYIIARYMLPGGF